MSRNVTIRLVDRNLRLLAHRSKKPTRVTNKIIYRYVALMGLTRRELAERFTPNECTIIVVALDTRDFNDLYDASFVPYSIKSHLRHNHAKYAGHILLGAFLDKINSLTLVERYTIVDAVEVWSRRKKLDPSISTYELFRNHPDDTTV